MSSDKIAKKCKKLEKIKIVINLQTFSPRKGKIENKNKVVQNRLLNDIKRFKIKSYDELNKWLNEYYIDYLNHKFSYSPKEEESKFVPLGNTDLTKIMYIKGNRTILNGNMISINNKYYIPIDKDGKDFIFYKDTVVEVWKDVFNDTVRIFKNNKIYNTRKIKGHRVDMEKNKKRIDEQKQLEILISERDEI